MDNWPIEIFTLCFKYYTSIQAAKLRFQHPEKYEDPQTGELTILGTIQLHYDATKDLMHTALDVGGLFPVIGEVCDLTNGVMYSAEGDWKNGTLSFTSAIPFVGWFSVGGKYAEKAISVGNGSTRTISWFVDSAGDIYFGSKDFLRKVINAPSGTQAHHIIPWEILSNPVVQSAAKKNGLDPFHMNDVVNGIALGPVQHMGSHPAYTNAISNKLNSIMSNYNSNLTPELANEKVVLLANKVRNILIQNPGYKVNDPVIVNLINQIQLW